jgi:hypothetical protein
MGSVAGLEMGDIAARPEGAVLIDTENVFKPFLPAAPKSFDPEAKYAVDAKKLNRRDLPLEEMWREGPAYFDALVCWLNRRFELVARRSYGKHRDLGVMAVYKAIMQAQSWTHTDVPKGKDKADDAIIEDLDLFAFNPRYKALIVASSDAESVLAKLDAIAAGGWHRCVAIMGPAILGRWRFQPGGGLEHLHERYTLAKIFGEESKLRTDAAPADAPPSTEVETVVRQARRKTKRLTAAQKRAAYAKLAEELHGAEADAAREEIRRRFGVAADAVAVSSIQVSMANAVQRLSDDARNRDLLDWIGQVAETARTRFGENPE